MVQGDEVEGGEDVGHGGEDVGGFWPRLGGSGALRRARDREEIDEGER